MNLPELSQIIEAAAKQAFNQAVPGAQISYPEPQFGDYATNAAFKLAKALKTAPNVLAQQLAGVIADPRVAEATAIGGFVNLKMTEDYWIGVLHQIGPNYGATNAGQGRKLQVEFISANPTGPITIANARGGFIGDVLARVMKFHGYQVTREYYFNNAGTQIKKLVESVKSAAGLIEVPDDQIQYRGDYIKELAKEYQKLLGHTNDSDAGEVITTAILQRYIEPAILKMGIEFDVWFNERTLVDDGTLGFVIQRLKDQNLAFERDNALWLDTGKLGLKREERVLIKSNGDPTYLAPDIAYHINVFEGRGFDVAIKILGPDHIDQFPSVEAAVTALVPAADLRMLSHQFMRIMQDGQELKISKRLGQYVTIEHLIEEVTLPVARFLTLMRSADSHMDFDMDVAREQSQKNPYFYVMYSYARANSVLEQARSRGLTAIDTVSHLTGEEAALIRQMSRFPGIINEISEDYGVHRLTFFGLDLARSFHDLYETERIIDLDKAEASKRLYVIERYTVFMRLYFGLLGITPQEKMVSPESI